MGYRNGRFFVQHPGESALVILCAVSCIGRLYTDFLCKENACEIAVHRAVSV